MERFKKLSQASPLQVRWQHMVPLIIIALTLYVVVPQLDQFSTSFQAVREASLPLVAVALLCIFCSVLSAAVAYRFLSFRRLPYSRIAAVQYSSMFINRLLPAGLGGMGLFALFFYRHKHTIGRASAVVVVNGMLGFLSHVSLILFCALLLGLQLPSLTLPTFEAWLVIGLALLAVGVVLSILYHTLKSGKIGSALRDLGQSLILFRKRPVALLGGYAGALGNTGLHVLAMAFVMAAFGQPFSIPIAIVVLTGGVLAATVSPTPGGLLASEAGIMAMLVAYGLAVGPALAIALTYRFVSYWLPIVPGIAAFVYVRRKRYV